MFSNGDRLALVFYNQTSTQAVESWKIWIVFKIGILIRIFSSYRKKNLEVLVHTHKGHHNKMHFSVTVPDCSYGLKRKSSFCPTATQDYECKIQKEIIVELSHLSYKIMASFCASCPSYWPFLAASWDWKLSAANQNCNTLTASSFSMYWKGNWKKRGN